MRAAHIAVLSCLLLPLATAACASDESDAAKVTEGFYGAYMQVPHDGVPDDVARAKLAPFVTPVLLKLMEDSEAAEARYAKETQNQSPPIIEGDLFTSLFEGATSYKVGACKANSGKEDCAVALTYDDHKDKPVNWTDTVILERTPDGWRVGDIVYGGKWDFGNKGRLSDTLKFAVKAAAAP